MRRLPAVVAVCVVMMGCASRRAPAPVASVAAPEHAGHDVAHTLAAADGPGYRAADVRFMQNMIGHHAQAVLMSALAPRNGAGERLRQLAQKIDISQRDEIELMKSWLRERSQPVPGPEQAHPMPGMLTTEQMAQLASARGVEFERLFLTYMIRHHQGALAMVEELFASPGAAQDSDIFRFATDVDADQRDEIHVMQQMLALLPGSTTR